MICRLNINSYFGLIDIYTVFVNSTNNTANIETAALSKMICLQMTAECTRSS